MADQEKWPQGVSADDVLRRMLATPPDPHAPKPVKPKPKPKPKKKKPA